ncbi:hypothetical protein CVIRNUC_000788 [Coccomyxa viridis]|uniref:Cystathionine beta-lyase n=1 Tax=Coccomyxa viridis TaxID=1274662 RepID=A0AAV1HSH0_9CHLO|nr:hypothetical protein CVIRNUC_000788 [Coccomyxa viridis]
MVVNGIHTSTEYHGKLDTIAVHGSGEAKTNGAAVLPVHNSVTYGVRGEYKDGCAFYTRPADTPNHAELAKKMALLEGTKAAVVTASGMAAISSTLFALLRSGDHLIIQDNVYGGTHELVHEEFPSLGIEHTTVDPQDPAQWEQALRPNTKVFYVESISNPLVRVTDLAGVAGFARRHGITPVVDNTFASPVLCRPADMGFVVVHSATKFLNGHSDLLAGVVSSSRDFIGKVTQKMVMYGGCLDPHACFLLNRGMATLGLRMRQQCASALAIAEMLQQHPMVENVSYPALASSPDHALATKLFGGRGGGVLSFVLRGSMAQTKAFLGHLHLPFVAPSLGGVESLVCLPAETSHLALGPDGRKAAGIPETLVRLSVGVEDTADLIQDIQQALAAAGIKNCHVSNGGAPH